MIRVAEPADLPGMLVLLRGLGSYDPSFDLEAAGPAWARLLSSTVTTVVVADVAGVIAAGCTLAVVPNLTWRGRPYAVIENVVTHPEHRRKGLGRGVLGFACDRAWAADCYKVTLSTGSQHEGTLQFYEAAGFTRNAKTFFEVRRSEPRNPSKNTREKKE